MCAMCVCARQCVTLCVCVGGGACVLVLCAGCVYVGIVWGVCVCVCVLYVLCKNLSIYLYNQIKSHLVLSIDLSIYLCI